MKCLIPQHISNKIIVVHYNQANYDTIALGKSNSIILKKLAVRKVILCDKLKILLFVSSNWIRITRNAINEKGV